MPAKTAVEGEKCALCMTTMNAGAVVCNKCGANRIVIPVTWAQASMWILFPLGFVFSIFSNVPIVGYVMVVAVTG